MSSPPLRRPQAFTSLKEPPSPLQPQPKTRLPETQEGEQGRVAMTDRECDVLMFVIEEQTTRQMAAALHLKPATIRTYLHSVFRKTRTSTRPALVKWWEHHSEEHIQKSGGDKGGKKKSLKQA